MSNVVLAVWNDHVATWNDTTTLWQGSLSAVPCAAIMAPAFPEAYQNRIPEDIYDSSAGALMDVWNSKVGVWNSSVDTWGTTGFIFVSYGPTLNH